MQVDLLMSERKEAKEAVQAQADGMKAAQVRPQCYLHTQSASQH
jgi:hypothetical protein